MEVSNCFIVKQNYSMFMHHEKKLDKLLESKKYLDRI